MTEGTNTILMFAFWIALFIIGAELQGWRKHDPYSWDNPLYDNVKEGEITDG